MLSLHGLDGGIANILPLLRSGDELLPTLDDQAVLLLVVLRPGLQPNQKSLKESSFLEAIPAHTSPPGLPPLFWPASASAAKSRTAPSWPCRTRRSSSLRQTHLSQPNSLKQSAPHQGVLVAVEAVPLRVGVLDKLVVMAASRIS